LGTFLVFLLLTTPFAVLAYELLIPWVVIRWLLLLVTVYGAIWILGLYASLRVLPYRLEPSGLRVHYGFLADGVVPYSAIAGVVVERHKAPGAAKGCSPPPRFMPCTWPWAGVPISRCSCGTLSCSRACCARPRPRRRSTSPPTTPPAWPPPCANAVLRNGNARGRFPTRERVACGRS